MAASMGLTACLGGVELQTGAADCCGVGWDSQGSEHVGRALNSALLTLVLLLTLKNNPGISHPPGFEVPCIVWWLW